MFQPKEYQRLTLEKLQQYFDECVRTGNAKLTFYALTDVPYHPVNELPGLPYVCLRIPTGGGKTVVACQSVGVAAHHLLRADHCVVLWLVPSDAIREQTLNALRDQRHPYRRALEAAVGPVAILDIEEALSVTRATLDTETTIIVSTMQAFRVKDKVGRKVYKEAGSLLSHFTNVDPMVLAEAERREDGSLIRSLTSVLRMRRPVIIVDEGI